MSRAQTHPWLDTKLGPKTFTISKTEITCQHCALSAKPAQEDTSLQTWQRSVEGGRGQIVPSAEVLSLESPLE